MFFALLLDGDEINQLNEGKKKKTEMTRDLFRDETTVETQIKSKTMLLRTRNSLEIWNKCD